MTQDAIHSQARLFNLRLLEQEVRRWQECPQKRLLLESLHNEQSRTLVAEVVDDALQRIEHTTNLHKYEQEKR